jgi:hypothetical protein
VPPPPATTPLPTLLPLLAPARPRPAPDADRPPPPAPTRVSRARATLTSSRADRTPHPPCPDTSSSTTGTPRFNVIVFGALSLAVASIRRTEISTTYSRPVCSTIRPVDCQTIAEGGKKPERGSIPTPVAHAVKSTHVRFGAFSAIVPSAENPKEPSTPYVRSAISNCAGGSAVDCCGAVARSAVAIQ